MVLWLLMAGQRPLVRMVCENLIETFCKKYEAQTNFALCFQCRKFGDKIKIVFNGRKTIPAKIIQAGSKIIAKVHGKLVDDETIKSRETVCRSCELIETDDKGIWCGHPIYRKPHLPDKKRGCGCYLIEKWKRLNSKCPKSFW